MWFVIGSAWAAVSIVASLYALGEHLMDVLHGTDEHTGAIQASMFFAAVAGAIIGHMVDKVATP